MTDTIDLDIQPNDLPSEHSSDVSSVTSDDTTSGRKLSKNGKPLGRPRKGTEKPKPKRAKKYDKPGRPPSKKFITYAQAREVVRNEFLHSRTAFEKWWMREKPKTIPRFPYRIYHDWVSWGDFLGTTNVFSPRKKSWRPYLEALHFVHSLNLRTSREWFDYCSMHDEDFPSDIPKRPDVVYKQWTSWNHWLGNKVVAAIEAKQEAAKVAVYYIIHEKYVPYNVFTYGIEPTGLTALKVRYQREAYDLIKFFWYDQQYSNRISAVVESLSTPYRDMERQRITPNVWLIVEQLEILLPAVTKAELYNVNTPVVNVLSPLETQPQPISDDRDGFDDDEIMPLIV